MAWTPIQRHLRSRESVEASVLEHQYEPCLQYRSRSKSAHRCGDVGRVLGQYALAGPLAAGTGLLVTRFVGVLRRQVAGIGDVRLPPFRADVLFASPVPVTRGPDVCHAGDAVPGLVIRYGEVKISYVFENYRHEQPVDESGAGGEFCKGSPDVAQTHWHSCPRPGLVRRSQTAGI